MAIKLYDKLVRDRIPEIIEADGKTCETRIANRAEKIGYLLDKIGEETEELRSSLSVEEMADLLEVVYSLEEEIGLDKQEVEAIRLEKKEKRGGFAKGIVLLKVEEN